MLLAATSEAVMCLSFPFMQLTLSSHQLLTNAHLKVHTTASWRNGLSGCIPTYSLAAAGEKCFCMSR